MTMRAYLDFDLQIDQLDAATFRARVLNSPAGQGEVTFELPFSDQELELFFLRIGRPRRGVRGLNSPEMNEARTFGSTLYQAVFQGGVHACWLRSLVKSDEQGLRIRLRLPPALVDLPWEYLYDDARERFFSHSTSTPIVRYLDMGQAVKPLTVTPPLNVLVMIASPRDLEPLDVEAEWQKIEAAVAGLKARGLIELTRLADAKLSALQRQLRREQYHIFHFIGHGGFDRQTQDGVLLLEDESGRSRLVSGNYLGTLLHDHPSLRLAVLNACEGARTTRSDPFAGVAQQLVRQGIPAVIAMQFEITDRAAIVLAREFYDALADGYPVDAALAEARKSIFTAGNDIEWGTPVLYMRAEDGQLFDVAALPPVDEPPAPTTPVAESVSAPTQTRAATIAPMQTDTVEKPPPDRQPRTIWRLPWFAVAGLALLLVVLGVWQQQLIRTWLGLGGVLPATTLTAPEETAAQTPSPAAAATPTTPQPASTATTLSVLNPISRTIWLNEGNNALAGGQAADWEIAKDKFEQILAVDPQDVAALLGLGTAQRWLGDQNNALISFSRAVAIAPDDPDANYALGLIFREEFDDYQRAIGYLTHAIETSPPGRRREEMYGVRATIYADEGEYGKAIADMDQVIAGDPNSDDYVVRAGIHRVAGNQEAAERDYAAAIDLSPSAGKYYLERADFYARLDQVDKAVADYDAFLRLRDPDVDQGLIDKAERYIALHAATATATTAPTATNTPEPTNTAPPTATATVAPTPTQTPEPTATPTLAPGATRAVTLAPGVEAIFVYVPAGPFTMGSPDGEGAGNEHPQHEVTLDAFWIMQTEVANAEYKAFIEAGGYTTESFWTAEGWQWRSENSITEPENWADDQWNEPEYPVVGVSWCEAVAFANWLADETGLPMRLPTEAEWEKAARGIDGRTYPWGDETPSDQILNYNSNVGSTTAVGSYPHGASPYGALDMAGNVWEWTTDWYAEEYYANSPASNPPGPESGYHRVVRGGSWNNNSIGVTAANRNGYHVDDRYNYQGLRLVWSPGD